MEMFREGELEFDFSEAVEARRLDEQGVPTPEGMSFVDFIIDVGKEVLLIEVKDPSHSTTPEQEREKFYHQLKGNELINKHLVPKCRDSYTFLHLMEKDTKVLLFIVIIAIDRRSFDEALLEPVKEKLLKRIRKEAKEPWVRQYVRDCLVLDLDGWNSKFPFPATRTE